MSLVPLTSRTCRIASKIHKSTLSTRSIRGISSQTSTDDCDIVIVGGGPAGLALASALGSSQVVRENLRIALVEGSDLEKVRNWTPKAGEFSNRVSSLTNASQTFLQDTGAWSSVELSRTCPVEEMQIWDGVSDARITFSAEDLGLNNVEAGMARLTENLNLQRGLLQHLQGLPEVELIHKTRVKSIERDTDDRGNWPLVALDNDRVLRARLLVGADGFNSPVRSYAKIPSFGWSYDTQAIVATMIHAPRGAFQGPNTTAYQRFLPTGPIAFLPLSPTVSSLVWSTKPALAAALLASEPPVLASLINAAFRLPEVSMRYLHSRILDAHSSGQNLTSSEIRDEILWRERSHAIDEHSVHASGAVGTGNGNMGIPPAGSEMIPPLVTSLQLGSMASFPLKFNHTESYLGEGVGARTVLVGDAAHTVHPLAGQGLNMGLADVESLAKCIEAAVLRGGDVGSYTALLPYAQERYFENHTLMGAIDKLHKIYSTTYEPLVWARTVGVEVLNELDSVKAAVMLAAGARQGRQERSGAAAWNFAAQAVETLAATNNTAKMLGRGLTGMLGAGLSNLAKLARNDSKNP